MISSYMVDTIQLLKTSICSNLTSTPVKPCNSQHTSLDRDNLSVPWSRDDADDDFLNAIQRSAIAVDFISQKINDISNQVFVKHIINKDTRYPDYSCLKLLKRIQSFNIRWAVPVEMFLLCYFL